MASAATPRHDKPHLLQCLLEAVQTSDWRCFVADSNHPFGLRLFRSEQPAIPLRVYIWNCTPGGKHRSPDEFRIQFTGAWPTPHADEVTLLLGWHDGYKVFVGWSVGHHAKQKGKSPSAQIKEGTLQAAADKSFSTQVKTNGQVVVAFQPQFFVEYAHSAERIHGTVLTKPELKLLDDVAHADADAIAAIPDETRRLIVARIARRYRTYNFRRRVLTAYRHRCAFCGVQLNLLDAAHILPVAAPASTDETSNGIALCKLHHAAFDGNLVSFDALYKVEVSKHGASQLLADKRAQGLTEFTAMLKATIILPVDIKDRPVPAQITAARSIRRWVP